METTAMLMMIFTQSLVTAITIYFFWKVLKTPPRSEPDSYSQNDELQKK